MTSNFDFLGRYWKALAKIGKTAESYLYNDPNAPDQHDPWLLFVCDKKLFSDDRS